MTNFFVYKVIFFLLLSGYSTSSFSQNVKIKDSLLQLLVKDKLSKKERIKILRGISISHPDLKEALKYAKESLQLSKEINATILQAEALEEISNIEHKLGNNGTSLQAALEALKIYESLKMIERQGATYTQLANNYLSNKEYENAIMYLKKAKRAYSNSHHSIQYISIIHNLGEAYRLFGKQDSAANSFIEVLKLNTLLKDQFIEGYTQGNLGMVYAAQNNKILAKQKLNKAIAILTKLKDAYACSVYIAELGEIYRKEEKWKNAEIKFLEAFALAKRKGFKEQIRDFSALLSKFYEQRENYSQALIYQKKYQIYQDSLVNKQKIKKIEQLKANYEIEKRESKISMLNLINKKQKIWVIILVVCISIVLVFVYLLNQANTKIKNINTILSIQKAIIGKREKEKALLLKELNHRIKNNLQMISSLLNLQSRELSGHPAKEAILSGRYRVDALSLVHQKLYQEDCDTKIIIKDYIEELVTSLFHGFDAEFNPIFKIERISINIDTAIPLALIINELIINSLKYAYKSINKPMLELIIKQNKDYLGIQIIDNGVGFEENEYKKDSFGFKLIFSLIEQLEGSIKKVKSNNGTHWKMNLKIA